MNGRRTCIVSCVIVALAVPGAAEELYSLSGVVEYSGPGSIYIYVVDEESSGTPNHGIRWATLVPDGEDLPFAFDAIPAGRYGIRCFQDRNQNGRLDRGIFGPTEPWAMSWQDEEPRAWPRWEDWSFEVNRDLRDITLVLEG